MTIESRLRRRSVAYRLSRQPTRDLSRVSRAEIAEALSCLADEIRRRPR